MTAEPQSAPVAWVTGGGTGIGKALAGALYRNGYRVMITGRRQDVLNQAVAEIGKTAGGEIMAMSGDASDPEHIAVVQKSVGDRWGAVHLLINNAGTNTLHSFRESTPDEFEQTFRINCMSAVRCSYAVLPGMLARRNGTIVNISSILGKWASPGSASYSTSKFAISGFTDTLRQDLMGTGIHVISVYPGLIRTAMTMQRMPAGSFPDRMGKTPEEMAHAIIRAIHRKKRDVYYPWYVWFVLAAHAVVPSTFDRLRKRFQRSLP